MAVNINTVYKAVLAIANKEQRGYITPQEFNILANQAQMDLFEQYFYDISQFQRRKGNSTEHSDMLHILEEKLASFRINNQALTASTLKYENNFTTNITGIGTVNPANGSVTYVAPATANNFDGGLKILQNANAGTIGATTTNFNLTAGTTYEVQWTIIDMQEPTSYSVTINDAGSAAHTFEDLEPNVGSNNFTFVADATGVHNIEITNKDVGNNSDYITIGYICVKEIDNATLGDGGTNEVYRMGNVHWKSVSATYPTRVDEITSHEATLYNSSSVARPTSSNPAYVRSGANSITIYPTPGSTDTITHDYIKVPATVEWGYNVILNKPIFKASSSTDFELHRSEEVNLVNRILVLAGLAIEDGQLFSAAGSEEIKDIQQEKL